MRLRLYVDGYPLEICTRDPELLARWLAEIFGAIQWTPATQVEVQAHPLFWPGDDGLAYAAPDWVARSPIVSQRTPVTSPRETAEALLGQVHRLEAEQAQELAEADPP
jgi:hypothetical protein